MVQIKGAVSVVSDGSDKIQNVIDLIQEARDEVAVVRSNPSDLTTIKSKIDAAQNAYDALDVDNKEDAVTNSTILTALHAAYEFMLTWYEEVRVMSNNKLDICEYANSENVVTLIGKYDDLDLEVKEILNDTYDVTGDDKSIIKIGQTMKYIISLVNAKDKLDNVSPTLTSPTKPIKTPIVAILLIASVSLFVVLSSIFVMAIIKRRQE